MQLLLNLLLQEVYTNGLLVVSGEGPLAESLYQGAFPHCSVAHNHNLYGHFQVFFYHLQPNELLVRQNKHTPSQQYKQLYRQLNRTPNCGRRAKL